MSSTPARASTFASQDSTSSTTASRNAALLGASTAFGRSTPKPKAPVNTYAGANGALAAASKTGTGSRNASPRNSVSMAHLPPLFPHSTGGSVRSSRDSGTAISPNPIVSLGLPPASHRGYSISPSHQAATLAAARAPPSANTSPDNGNAKSQVKRPAVAPKPRSLSSGQRNQNEDNDTDEPTDATPIPPTTSLVDLFERKSSVPQGNGKRPEPIVIKPSKDLAIKSPKPVRTSGGITSMFQMELEEANKTTPKAPAKEIKQSTSEERENRPPLSTSSPHESVSSVAMSTKPMPPPPRTSTTSKALALETKAPVKRAPSPSPLRNSTSEAIDIHKPACTTTTPLDLFPTSPTSLKSLPAQYNNLYPRKMTPSMTGDQLANAMVAGSLASSRAGSPWKQDPGPPPLPTRRPKHHHTFSFSRTPSPSKTGMLHTLRKTASDTSDDDDEDMLHPYSKHKRKKHMRRHPNKHHEGDRKRWRDALNERERKRYEGVWAANKGLYCSFSREEEIHFRKIPSERKQAQESFADEVSNIVVRDIWNRSRLPETTLEMVWDLVDGGNVGRLGKEEFVVGLWLIDQRLKGRKLPSKVSESVWASVRSLQGIKIKK